MLARLAVPSPSTTVTSNPNKRHSHVKFSSWAGTLKQSPVAKTSSTSGKLKPYLFPDVHSSL